MHSYLRSIGFSYIRSRRDLDHLIDIVMQNPTKKAISKNEKNTYMEISKEFSDKAGITIFGELDDEGNFHMDHYFPYFEGKEVTTREEVVLNKRVDTDAYTGMCDDIRLGVSLIFYVQNVIECMNNNITIDGFGRILPTILSGLSTSGKILLGREIEERQRQTHFAESKHRNKLIAEAKKGNQDAIDSLTIDDIDLYAMISRRARYEDIYTIVDTTFIPYGSESDNYSILGTILDVRSVQNTISKEQLYYLLVNCNDMVYDVCINSKDLSGEPLVGRRFKGNVWMQGKIHLD